MTGTALNDNDFGAKPREKPTKGKTQRKRFIELFWKIISEYAAAIYYSIQIQLISFSVDKKLFRIVTKCSSISVQPAAERPSCCTILQSIKCCNIPWKTCPACSWNLCPLSCCSKSLFPCSIFFSISLPLHIQCSHECSCVSHTLMPSLLKNIHFIFAH